MPELPEVQTVVNDLIAAGLPGAGIRKALVFWPRTVDRPDVTAFCRQLQGQTIQGISRRAKYIVMALTQGLYLLVHLRMTGRLHILHSTDVTPARHEHIILQLNDQRQLRFADTRKFGRLYLTTTPDDLLGALGPEPLDKSFTARHLFDLLQRRTTRLKPLLLNQHIIAGLGNIYVDEALWEAYLHPCRRSNTLSVKEAITLHRAMRKVLRSGLAHLGTSLGRGQTNFFSVARRQGGNQHNLKVFRRQETPCQRCGVLITRQVVAQRSTFTCPACQPQPTEIS